MGLVLMIAAGIVLGFLALAALDAIIVNIDEIGEGIGVLLLIGMAIGAVYLVATFFQTYPIMIPIIIVVGALTWGAWHKYGQDPKRWEPVLARGRKVGTIGLKWTPVVLIIFVIVVGAISIVGPMR